MENSYISEQLKNYKIKNKNDYLNAIRETAQKIILVSLAKKHFFDLACFNGGTCLRLFYNASRFSEDLDFDLIKPVKNLDFEIYAKSIISYLSSFGLEASYQISDLSKKTIDTDVYTCYIKINLSKLAEITNTNFRFPKTQLLTIKLDISTTINSHAKYEYKNIVSPTFASIKVFDNTTLFASKLHAILFRQYKNRVKGRDYFDYVFYVANNTPVNLKYLSEKANTNLNLDKLEKLLKDKFSNLSYKSVYDDLSSFVDNDFDFTVLENKKLLNTVNDLKIKQ